MKISLDETYYLLRKFKQVIFDEDVSHMKVELNEDGLIVTLKNKREKSVMLFPPENNVDVEITDNSVALYDGCKWRHDFQPLMSANLC